MKTSESEKAVTLPSVLNLFLFVFSICESSLPPGIVFCEGFRDVLYFLVGPYRVPIFGLLLSL